MIPEPDRRMCTHAGAAHYIRHDDTQQFHAAVKLSAKFRWCLTGTPIHNSLTDLGSLVTFLRIPLLQRKAEFQKYVTKPIEDSRGGDPSRNLRLLLQSICLRRTKELINLPEPEEITYDVHLSRDETTLYRAIEERARHQMEEVISNSEAPGTGKAVLQMVMNLRRICNHGTMNRDIRYSVDSDEAEEYDSMGGTKLCPDCKCEIMDAGRLTPDGKTLLCVDCYSEWERRKQKRGSKNCKTTAASNNGIDLSGHSTKISLLVQDVDQHRGSDKWFVHISWLRLKRFC